MGDPGIPSDRSPMPSPDLGNRLQFGSFIADSTNYGHGAVVDVFFARMNKIDAREESDAYVVRAAKNGSEAIFAEEIRVRELAKKSADPVLLNHMPQLIYVDRNHLPPYLVVSRKNDGIPLNKLGQSGLNPREKRNIASSFLEYVHHWHRAGIVLDDLGAESDQDRLLKCDRFLVSTKSLSRGGDVDWIDIDANMTQSIEAEGRAIDQIEIHMHDELEQARSFFLWAKAGANRDVISKFSQVEQAVSEVPRWSTYEENLRKRASVEAFGERGVVRKIGALGASEEAIQQKISELRPEYELQFAQAKAKAFAALKSSVQTVQNELSSLGIRWDSIPQGIEETELKKIQIFCQLLQKADEGDEQLASFVAEHSFDLQQWRIGYAQLNKRLSYLRERENQIERLLGIKTTEGIVESTGTSGDEGFADRGLLKIQHIRNLPDLVVKHKTGVITKRDYTSLAGIFSELLSNGNFSEAQRIYHQFVAMIERESGTMTLSLDARLYEGMRRILTTI